MANDPIIRGGGIINVSYIDTDPIQKRSPLGTLPPAQTPLDENLNYTDLPRCLSDRLIKVFQPAIKDPTILAPEPYRKALESVNEIIKDPNFWQKLPNKTDKDSALAKNLQALFENEIENQNLFMMYKNLLYSA